jgi:hypothetical protein
MPNIVNLRNEVRQRSRESEVVVAFLGDNIYERGLHDPSHPDRSKDLAYLNAEIDVVRGTAARGMFVPGNHDWGYGGEHGLRQIQNQGAYMDSLARREGNVAFLPPAGCPGPISVSLGDLASLVFVDTDLWLRDQEPVEGCEHPTIGKALDALRTTLAANASGEGRHVIVLAHHPLKTYGPHGGYFGLKDQFFPLTNKVSWLYIPIPFLYPIVRNSGVSSGDMSSSRNNAMREAFAAVFSEFPGEPLVWGAGHDHSLQVFRGGEYNVGYILVSGAGSQPTNVGWDDALFASGKQHGEMGYMRLEFFSDGRVLLSVISDGTRACASSDDCVGRPTVRYWRWLADN